MTVDDLYGCDPNFTEGLGAVEYVRRLRDEDHPLTKMVRICEAAGDYYADPADNPLVER